MGGGGRGDADRQIDFAPSEHSQVRGSNHLRYVSLLPHYRETNQIQPIFR